MQVFRYEAARMDGTIDAGEIEAQDVDHVSDHLKSLGHTPIQIQALDAGGILQRLVLPRRDTRVRLKANDIELLTLELATLLDAGLPVGEALATLEDLADQPVVAAIASGLARRVREGESLSEALAASNQGFDRFYINMVRAGESTGQLVLTLKQLAKFKSETRAQREQLISTLIYPAILLVMSVIAVGVMLAFVVPRFSTLFAESGQTLPLLTQIVVGTGTLVTHWWWLIVALVGAVSWWIIQDLKRASGQARWGRWFLGWPVVGSLIRRIETARFSRTLGTLLHNGVPAASALSIARAVVGNSVIQEALDKASTDVRAGESLAKKLSESGEFPSLAIQLIRLGERTGKLDQMLLKVAEIHEGEVERRLKRLSSLAEPVIIVTIALFISVIILSVVLMILESNNLPF